MESIFPFIGLALFALICPLVMVAIGGIAWLVARARGDKGSFGMGCMTGHGGHHQAAATPAEKTITEEVARLQSELDALRARRQEAPGAVVINIAADGSIPTVSGLPVEHQA